MLGEFDPDPDAEPDAISGFLANKLGAGCNVGISRSDGGFFANSLGGRTFG
jgi:hypothetical protein